MRESTTFDIFTGQTYVNALLQQGAEGHSLRKRPVYGSVLHHLHASLEDTQQTLVDFELGGVRRRRRESSADVNQSLFNHTCGGHLVTITYYL